LLPPTPEGDELADPSGVPSGDRRMLAGDDLGRREGRRIQPGKTAFTVTPFARPRRRAAGQTDHAGLAAL
jgi:hypothetical protein